MINVLLNGALGAMGNMVAKVISQQDDIMVMAGIDKSPSSTFAFPVYTSFKDISGKPDALIDFSHPDALASILDYCIDNYIPAVICTTAHSEAQRIMIEEAAKVIPVYYSYNNSVGICLMQSLVKTTSGVLEDFDVEIIEKHHRRKLDAPSGTALMLANAVNEAFDEDRELIFDRHQRSIQRPKNEIGMHSIRGGTVVGEHSVIFLGQDEVIEIKHTAFSREVFATGAVRAVRFIIGKPSGLYNMKDVLGL